MFHDAEPDVVPFKLIDATSESDNVSPTYSLKVQLIALVSSVLFLVFIVILNAALFFDTLEVKASLFKGHATEIFVSVSVLVKPDSRD